MPTKDHLVEVARSVRRDLDQQRKAFVTLDRFEFTRRLRQVSGATETRLKTGFLAPAMEDALRDQGLRCHPSLSATTTGDRIRVFRAGSVVGDLIDAVLAPSAVHDRVLQEALAKYKGTWHAEGQGPPAGRSTTEILRQVLPRERHLALAADVDDPDLATT